jgi:hypothetical protein
MRPGGVAVGVAVALSASTRSGLVSGALGSITTGNLSTSTGLLSRSGGPRRVRAGHVERLRQALSERDWAVMRDVARMRLVTGAQLERLHFAGLGDASRPVVRRRVLGRLVQARVLATLERRVGGVRAGSEGLIYFLDTAGQRLLIPGGVARKIDPPGERYMRHVLAVTELYVSLTEQARAGGLRLDQFKAEPASWWTDGRGSRIKPDGYVRVSNPDHADAWWLEVDLATEHLPTLKRKLGAYFDFYRQGQLGPDGIMPLVLVTAPSAKRCSDIVRLIRQFPSQGAELFTVALHNDAAEVIMRRLHQP